VYLFIFYFFKEKYKESGSKMSSLYASYEVVQPHNIIPYMDGTALVIMITLVANAFSSIEEV
jgi:hypothetical protein